MQTINTLSVGVSFTLFIVLSLALSVKGILEKFKVDKIVTFTGELWNYYDRVYKYYFIMSTIFVPLIGLFVGVMYYYFGHDMQYAWHASREAVARPGLIRKEEWDSLASAFMVALYILAGLASLGLGYCCYKSCTNKTNNEKRE